MQHSVPWFWTGVCPFWIKYFSDLVDGMLLNYNYNFVHIMLPVIGYFMLSIEAIPTDH